ncbi:hypothetical protein FF1_004165 [Malus domestica]
MGPCSTTQSLTPQNPNPLPRVPLFIPATFKSQETEIHHYNERQKQQPTTVAEGEVPHHRSHPDRVGVEEGTERSEHFGPSFRFQVSAVVEARYDGCPPRPPPPERVHLGLQERTNVLHRESSAANLHGS